MKTLPKQTPRPRRFPVRNSIRRKRSGNRNNRSRTIPEEPAQLASIQPNRRLVKAASRRARRRAASDQNEIPPNQRRSVICDGESLSYDEISKKFYTARVQKAVEWFENIGHSTVAVVPNYLWEKAEDSYYLDNLSNSGKLVTFDCEPGTAEQNSSLERQLLDKAVQEDAAVVSEREFRGVYGEKDEYNTIAKERVIGYCFFKSEIFIPVDPYGRYGPLLRQILQK